MYSDFEQSKETRLYRELSFSYHALQKAKKEYDDAVMRHNSARLNYIAAGLEIPDQFLFTG